MGIAAVNASLELKPLLPSTPVDRKEWVLARARVMSAGLRLVLFQIDEIGIALKHDWISADRAAADLAALEQLPVFVASVLLSDVESESA
jgi:hypothetical protein